MIWFQPCALEPLYKFELLGLLVSLAVYNGVVLPLNFPKALYRKLLGLPVFAREHIQDGWPTLAKSFGQLLAWEDDDVKDVFMRTYEFSIEARGLRADIDMEQVGREDPWLHRVAHLFGGFPEIPEAGDQDPGESHRVHQLARGQDDPDEDVERPNAAEQPDVTHTPQSARMVTNGNRYDYVDDYIFWLTDKSVRPQYEAFARGFFTCLNKKALSVSHAPLSPQVHRGRDRFADYGHHQIFTPEALQTVVEGSPNIDVAALEETARYEDGYSSTHPVIKDFWSIVHGYSAQERRQLLEFVTASERVPVSGMQSIQFIIQRNGPDSEVSHPTTLPFQFLVMQICHMLTSCHSVFPPVSPALAGCYYPNIPPGRNSATSSGGHWRIVKASAFRDPEIPGHRSGVDGRRTRGRFPVSRDRCSQVASLFVLACIASIILHLLGCKCF